MARKILGVLSIITGLLMLNGGLNKFLNYMPPPDNMSEAMMRDMEAILEISWLMPLLGVAEIVGGILLIIPRTRALGALVLLPVAVGILLTHIFVDTEGLIIAVVIWAILIWLLFDNQHKYGALIDR